MKSKAHEKLAAVIAEMRDLSCECRKIHAQRIKEGYIYKITSLKAANEKIVGFMKSKYMEVANNLKTDLRIFTGSNTAIFLFLFLLSFLNRMLFLICSSLVFVIYINHYLFLFLFI